MDFDKLAAELLALDPLDDEPFALAASGVRRGMPNPECPVSACGFNANMQRLDADHERPLTLRSTRSHEGEDAWRDMDGFNGDEELARLRRAVHEVRRMNPEGFERHHEWRLDPETLAKAPALLAFICEAFTNIDDNLSRLGPLPHAWQGSSTVSRLLPKSREAVEKEAADIASGQLQMKAEL